VGATYGPTDVRRWAYAQEGARLSVAIRVVLDWRFLLALAILARVLLNR
jgi:hypothetical protein